MRFLAFALLFSGCWGLSGILVAQYPQSISKAIHNVFDTLRYGAWYGFILLLIKDYLRDNAKTLSFKIVAASIVILSANTIGQVLLVAVPEHGGGLINFLLYAQLSQAIFGLVLLEQLFRNSTPDSLWNVKPLGISLVATFLFDLYFFSDIMLFRVTDPNSFVVRGYAHALVAPLAVLMLHRLGARSLKISLSKTAAFHTTSLLFAGFYLLIVAAAAYLVRHLGGNWGSILQLALMFTATLVLMLMAFSGSIRSKIRILIGKHFLRYRYDYREEWLKFTNALTSSHDRAQIGLQVIKGLAGMVESPGGALWSLDISGERFSQIARWNIPESNATESKDSPLIQFLTQEEWVVNLEEMRHKPGRYRNLTIPEWLQEIPNTWLIVPLRTASGVVGFVVLSTARVEMDVNWEVNDLLQVAGRQAAAFLAQIQASEALLEARKFDSFNRMSAFVVHDLKNIVTQLSLLLSNAERHSGNAEFQSDMLLTVRHSADRMKQLMLQLREGTPSPAGTCGVDLGQVSERVRKEKAAQAPIELHTKGRIIARGHEDRIERVIGHLAQNAIDATPAGGRIWIKVEREGSSALVEVGDTGHGMSPEFIRDQLFRPFKTTKQAGMGIGAYESQQYVRELGGEVKVESTENVGTRFRIKLPLIDLT